MNILEYSVQSTYERSQCGQYIRVVRVVNISLQPG